MSATGYTPIQLYYSTTASAVPLAANLASGELAINVTDGRLYYKDNAGAVQLLSTSTTATGTANGVLYLNGSKVATSGSSLVFDGNNMGLGTSSPSSYTNFKTLEVAAGGGTKGGLLRISGASNTVIGYFYADSLAPLLTIGSDTSTDFSFVTGATERMRLTSTGLGIGTSSPNTKLEAVGTISARRVEADQAVRISSAGGENYIDSYNNANTTRLPVLFRQITTSGTTEAMRLDSSGNLGIGTSSPSYKLDVTGQIRASVASGSAQIRLERTATTAGASWIGADADALLRVYTTGFSTQLMLDSSGNLGLGVTPGTGTSNGFYLKNNANICFGGSVSYYDSNSAYSSGADRYITSAAAARYQHNGGAHSWFTAPSGTAGNAITFTQAMTLNASGNLGIGTSSPGARLDLQPDTYTHGTGQVEVIRIRKNPSGGTTTSPTSAGAIVWGNGTTTQAVINSIIDNPSASSRSALAFSTNVAGTITEAMRLDSSGNLLVGTTSVLLASRLSSVAVGDQNGGAFKTNAAGGTYTAIAGARNGNNGNVAEWWYDTSTQVGTISVTSTATAYNTSSDYRLKNIDGPLTGSGAFIDALKPKVGTWKADGSRFVGFLAHEVQEVSPNSVTGQKDGEKMQAMEYGSAEFIANIIAELQSLRKRLADAGIA